MYNTQNISRLCLSLWQGLKGVRMASLVMGVLLLLFSYAPAFAASAPVIAAPKTSPAAPKAAPAFAQPTIAAVEAASDSVALNEEGVQYYKISSKIHFERSRTDFNATYMDNATQLKAIKHMLDSVSAMEVVGVNVVGSASPEGTLKFNTYLATNRAARLKNYLVNTYDDFFADSLEWNVSYEYEDWSYVEELLAQSDIKYRDEALDIIKNTPYLVYDANGKVVTSRKKKLMDLRGGSVWREMDAKIFPYSRGAELQIIVKAPSVAPVAEEVVDTLIADTTCYEPECEPVIEENCKNDTLIPVQETKEWRQPMLAVKTNLLFYGAYIPKYGWGPIPNIGIEFLPRHGHWTVGASLDIPWYQNYSNHKFLQARNWQIEARRYFNKGDAHYWGWYAQVYVHTGLFGIGFNKEEGWQGESVGGGIGGGYVLPLSKNKHWKLEFNLQVGYIRTQYDPYVYGHPTNGIEDGLYYYNWTHDPDLFKERQYRHNWLGPTRVGVTLSYDLLYYPRKKANKNK